MESTSLVEPMQFRRCPGDTKLLHHHIAANHFSVGSTSLVEPMRFPRRPSETKLLDDARKQAEELQEDVRTSELKVARMICQARLGVRLRRLNEWRLWRLSGGGGNCGRRCMEPKNMNLQKDKKASVITLPGIEIFPKVGEQGGEAIVGTLDVHRNGFVYATSSPYLHFHFLYTNVRGTFFRVGDEEMPPLLHFHLRRPVKVGAEMRQNIQFRLVQTPVGQMKSNNGSEKQTGNGESFFKNFAHDVEAKWRRYSFGCSEVHKMDEFRGNLPSKAPTVFGLTYSALVGLADEPFVVVILNKIEFVTLRLKPAVIDMTIVFRNFKRDLVHINSIPIAALDLIKDCYNSSQVKYYEIYEDLPWDSIVKGMADPVEFTANGGWSYYRLEDCATAKLYKYYEKAKVEEYPDLQDGGKLGNTYCEAGDTYCGSEGESETLEDCKEQ